MLNRLLRLVFALAILAASVPVWAFGRTTAVFNASISPNPSRTGEFAALRLHAQIVPGWHIYSLDVVPPPGPTPTTIDVEGKGFRAGKPIETSPTRKLDPNFGKVVAYHEGDATFTVPLRVTAKSGMVNVNASITFQSCSSTTCMPPQTQTLHAGFKVIPGPARKEFLHVPLASANYVPGSPNHAGIWGLVATAFVAGLLALLTPCVFPLIPVTFGFFTKQAGGSGRAVVALASVYALGIILSFTILGLVMAATLGASGANRVASNPWFNLFFGVMFVVFAFTFFETFQLKLPGSLSGLGGILAGRVGGITGVLLMGLAFVFAAFTCTAPFVGSILVMAVSATSSGAWLLPVLGMVTFALALALPFFLLALFPRLLSRLPKSGGWLSRLKGVLGFVELAYAVTYFSKADLVWQALIFTRPMIFGLWAAISIGAALYVVGALRVSRYQDEAGPITPWRALVSGLFVLGAVYCLYALTGRPINATLAAYLPDAAYGTQDPTAASTPEGLTWLSSYDVAIARAKVTNTPVFIDFTGYTCTNCRWMELNVFDKPNVKSSLSKFILLKLYTDGGPGYLKNQKFEQDRFGSVALPLYGIVSPDGRVVSKQEGIAGGADGFAAFLGKTAG